MKPVKVGICGLGTVGGGTFNVLKRNADEIARRAGRSIIVEEIGARRDNPAIDTKGTQVSRDIFAVATNPEIDIVVELIGGYDVARDLVLTAIENGKHVVTANKALIAEHGNEIFEAAQKKNVMVAFEAGVAGGIPIIKAIREGLSANKINWLAGIINGTGNFILTEMKEKGRDFDDVLKEAQELVVSPGVAISEPAIAEAMHFGVSVVGDVELFARELASRERPEGQSAPDVIAITGSNAKSTVTSLVGFMAEKAGINVGVGGNIGLPVLELLEQDEKALYVLELSSFQLETTHTLNAKVATILNISPDHMDRYPDIVEYGLAKQRIYVGCQHAVVNRADEATLPVHQCIPHGISFGLDHPDNGQLGLRETDQGTALALGDEILLPVDQMTLTGRHGQENALSSLALGLSAGLPMNAMLEALGCFESLPHRCQPVAEIDGVQYINDSKGTNVGATVAALKGLGPGLTTKAGGEKQGKIVLIAGGDGKGAEFDDLVEPVQDFARAVVLIGRDGPQIEDILPASIKKVQAGQRVIAPELALMALEDKDPLSDKERKAIKLAGDGLKTADIAAKLYLSEGTVRNYLSEAIAKLNATNRIDAARIAKQKGWI